MSLLKKVLVVVLIFSLIVMSSTTAFAAEQNEKDNSKKVKSINLLEKSDNVIISDVLTFDEISRELAKSKGISLDKAKQIVGSTNEVSTANSSRISITSSFTYRTVAVLLDVKTFYKPTLRFYCRTSESGNYWGITEIFNVELQRDYRYELIPNTGLYETVVKQFAGNIYTQLISPYQIFYIINGDFYDNGTTTYNGGVSVKVGDSVNISVGVSYSSNWYAYIYKDGIVQTQY